MIPPRQLLATHSESRGLSTFFWSVQRVRLTPNPAMHRTLREKPRKVQ